MTGNDVGRPDNSRCGSDIGGRELPRFCFFPGVLAANLMATSKFHVYKEAALAADLSANSRTSHTACCVLLMISELDQELLPMLV